METAKKHCISPYSPTEPISDLEKLVGRSDALRKAITLIYSGRNLVVTGDRGIGKTSFINILCELFRKEDYYGTFVPKAYQFKTFFVAICSCIETTNIESLIDTLLRSLTRSTGLSVLSEKKKSWSLGAKVAPFEAKISEDHKESRPDIPISLFVDTVAKLFNHKKNVADFSLLFTIDEADQLNADVKIGTFIRSSKEMLRNEGFENISFILSGQKNLLLRLTEEHPSVPRAFEDMWLPPLSNEGCCRIIEIGENECQFEFDAGIRKLISKSSRGFPAVVHRLAESCFESDKDNYIDLFDFEDGLSAAIKRVRGEEALSAIEADAGNVGKEILVLLSDCSEFLHQRKIIEQLRYEKDSTLNAINYLIKLNIIETENDSFRISDRLLSAYIALENTRERDLRNIRNLANLLERRGWSIRAIGPDEYRGIDFVITKGKWFFKRTTGVAFIGDSTKLSEKGILKLIDQTKRSIELYGLDEIWIVGNGYLDKERQNQIKNVQRLGYYPWETIEKSRYIR